MTFLAFSNGSPDVFSTFAALKSDSGALAIGELIGAASFIVSVVAGTMCLIQPFQVSRYTFLRDVGFFTIAVSFTLGILWDGHIHAWEALTMVGLYVAYASLVGFGSWYRARREAKRERIRQARNEFAVEEGEGYRDEEGESAGASGATLMAPARLSRESSGSSLPTLSQRTPHLHLSQSWDQDGFFGPSDGGASVTLIRPRSNSVAPQSPTSRRPATRSAVRPSLLGAIEFRDVVNSLSADSTARSLSVFSGEDHAHAHVHSSSTLPSPALRRSRATTLSSVETERAKPGHARKTSWAGATDMGAGAWSPTEGRGPASGTWGNDDSDSEDEGAEGAGAVVDLSAGVENPWQSGPGGRSPPLRVNIPSFQSSATTARTARARSIAAPSPNPTAARSRESSPPPPRLRRMPSILLTTDQGEQQTVLPAATLPPKPAPWHKRPGVQIARAVFLALFPSLDGFGQKSWLGRATAVLCVPAILLLNLTLPVVDEDEDECESVEEKEEGSGVRGTYRNDSSVLTAEGPVEGLLIDVDDQSEASTPRPHHHHHYSHQREDKSDMNFHAREAREAVAHKFHSRVQPQHSPELDNPSARWAEPTSPSTERAHMDRFNMASSDAAANVVPGTREPSEATSASPTGEGFVGEAVSSEVLTRWLTVVQCTLGPVFCVTALLIEELKWWQPLTALAIGLCLSSFAYWCFEDSRHPGRITLCFVGFLVAMVWILMIVNEVVGVLQTFGHIFGLSDAILGLTIFAMGNSLGDLVANATVARMGFPSMAIAACFGGPMLNILLGVGLSGSYLIAAGGGEALRVDIGRTLLVSGGGLLGVLVATLIVVPWNGFWMGRGTGVALIGAYVVVLTVNVCVEIFW